MVITKLLIKILLKKKAIGAVTKLTYAKLVDYRDAEEISDKCRVNFKYFT